MAGRGATDGLDFSIATIPPTPRQRKLAVGVVAVLLVGFAVVAPFAATRLPRLDSFVPTVEAIVLVADLATSALLFSQYANVQLRGLLILADGYLLSALIVVPHALSYPGAFAPGGLFVSGLQVTPWLYTAWHLLFSVAVLVYACLKRETQNDISGAATAYPAIYWNVAAVATFVCAFTWLVTAGEKFVPRLIADEVSFTPMASYVTGVTVATTISALLALWVRRNSLLDLWLMVATVAALVEQAIVSLFIGGRFSVGFYTSRLFSVVVSTIVLVALLSETITLYARLVRANRALQRERDSKLLNLEVAVAAIAHEVRQPLTGIATMSAAARRFLSREPPDIPRVQAILDEVAGAGFRTNEVIESVRALFRSPEQDQHPVDLNGVTLEALQLLRRDFDDYGIIVSTELTSELPLIMGNKGQLREVVLNLMQNAIDAMAGVMDRRRRLRVETERREGTVAISVEDSGPGIDPKSLPGIFDPFVTTKTNGMGLGLAISQIIVERHNGQLAVVPGAVRGARFQVTFPIKPASDAAGATG
ncbi:MAG: MASE4 domain-containing protein [Xanthobacteraceae bacterium]